MKKRNERKKEQELLRKEEKEKETVEVDLLSLFMGLSILIAFVILIAYHAV